MKRFAYRWITCAGLQGIAILMLAGVSQASRKPFEHYAPILTRRPFGVRAPAVEVEAPPPAPRPDFARKLKLVALRDGTDGVRIGLVDESASPPQSLYLQLGVTEDGVTILDVDFEGGRALVRKDGHEDWISMRTGESAEAAPAAVPGAGAGAAAAAAAEAARESSAAGLSYAERRRQRLETMRSRVREPEAPSVTTPDPAELEQQLQEYQMKLIRSGRTPLPIPLSEEADAQLVAEGLLPP